MKSGMKSIAIIVPQEYPFGGAVVKKGINTLFSVVWEQLTEEQQKYIMMDHQKEIDMLDWDEKEES